MFKIKWLKVSSKFNNDSYYGESEKLSYFIGTNVVLGHEILINSLAVKKHKFDRQEK